jgi:tetratricopeptide (TPR) repeat protein
MDKLKIFISGTQDDMQPEREAVDRAMNATTLATGIRAETAVSQPQSPRAWIEQQLRECNIYIGVYSHRYGWVVPDKNVSATEFEYNLACELKKPRLIWIRKLRDEEKGKPNFDRQEEFLSRVSDFSTGHLRQEFDNTADLEKWVTDAIGETFTEIIRHSTATITATSIAPVPHDTDNVSRDGKLPRQRTRFQSNRDDFSSAVKRRLAERVGFCCSNPNCQKPTSGPSSDPLGAVNIGVASHITAAAPGGPRYDPLRTHEERQSPDNGIWLCQNCGKLVDNDERGFPAPLLDSWKASAETRARNSIESPYYPLQQTTGSAALVVLSEKVNVLADWATDNIESDLDKILEEFREGHKREARQRLERVKTKSVWDVLNPTVKAKILRVEARVMLNSQNEIRRAKELLVEADSLVSSEESQRLRAFIAFREGSPETGIEIIGSQENIDSLNLRASLLLNLGRVDEALTVLEQATQVDSSSAETHRLRALAFLLHKELGQAQSAIERALELKPRWQTVQYVSAVIHYWSALSPAILPNSFVPWPAPVDWAFIKSDDSSRAHLQQAANLFHELMNVPEQREEERKYLEGWYLACLANDLQKQEEGATFCRTTLKRDPTHYPIVTWVTARGMDVSMKASEHALEQRLKTNSATVSDILALVQCFLAKGHGRKALKILQRAKPLFEKQKAMWVHWYAQANISAGKPERALAVLDEKAKTSEQNKTRTIVLSALANKSKDWQTYLDHLDRTFSETQDPVLLLEYCGVKARLGDWVYVADRATNLVTAIRTVEVVRLGAYATFNTRRFSLCLQLLDASRDLFPQQKLSVELRCLRIRCQYALGALPRAVSEAETLAREEPTLVNLMSLAEIYFDKGDLKRLAVIAQQINQHPDLSVEWALHLAHMLLWEDAQLARTLWRRANANGIPDEGVSAALDLGFRLGLDNEMRVLMQRMQALGSARRGGIELKTFEDLIDFVKQRREHLSELEELYRNADIPIHLFAYQLNQSLAFFYHQLLVTNARELTPLIQSPLLVRHGGRVLVNGFPDHSPKWRLHLDITALLCADHFGVLDAVEKTFSTLQIPSSLPRALARMRGQLMPHQPSKFVEYGQIADLVNRGTLKIAQPISPIESEKQIVDELGEDWTALYELARSRNGYIVDFLPLTKKGSTISASALPTDAKAYVVNCRSIVDARRQHGPLSEESYTRALEQLGEQARVIKGGNIPPIGAQLYCVGNIPEVFAGANLLSMVCDHFEVYIEQTESQAVKGALASRHEQEITVQWVDSLIQRVQVGIERGTYEIIPVTWGNENAPEQISFCKSLFASRWNSNYWHQ